MMVLIGRAASLLALVGHGVVAAMALPFLILLWLLPWHAALALGRFYGFVAWAVMPEARRVGAINLRRALDTSLSRHDARRSVWSVFGSLAQGLAEGVQFARRFRQSPANARALYECEDPLLEQRILNDPRPRIFLTGHLGSWELATSLAALRTGRPGSVIARRIDNPFLNELWRLVRLGHGDWIEKRGAASVALARLRRGEDVAMLLDENGGPRGLFVPFFNRLAATRKTPAVLSLAAGAPVIVGACIRRPGRPFLYRLALLEPRPELPPGDAIRDLTIRIVAVYEAWIRETPLQWRWIHWRWKARPDGSEECYSREALRRAFQPPTRVDSRLVRSR